MYLALKQHDNVFDTEYCEDEYIKLLHTTYISNSSDYRNVIDMITIVQKLVEEIHNYCIINVDEYFNDINEVIQDFSQENINFINAKINNIEKELYNVLGEIYRNNVKNEKIIKIIDTIYNLICKYDMLYFTTTAHKEWRNRKELLVRYNRFQLRHNKTEKKLVDHEEIDNINCCGCFQFIEELKNSFTRRMVF